MALIGPRPIVADEVQYYGASYATVSSVRPGITGLWQVSGRSDTDYDRRVALDTYYVVNWSPWLDVWILLRTILVVVLMRGAR
jgi:lipopolysaccharide/colanic/teichoic acid biosynthesis glycosyltransferase